MARPILVQFKINTPKKGVRKALRRLRGAIAKLWRRRCFREIPAAVGGLHVDPPTKKKPRTFWIVHAHVVVDAFDLDDEVDDWEAEVKAQFRRLTDGVGVFSIDDGTDVRSPGGLAWYVNKPENVSPPPGTLDLDVLDALLDALHGQDLTIRLGRATGRGRHFPKTVPTP